MYLTHYTDSPYLTAWFYFKMKKLLSEMINNPE